MINLARDRNLQTSTVSFRGAIPEAETRDRVLSGAEAARLFPLFPDWLRRLAEVARETALSEGDMIRLTDEMIDTEQGVIVPAGGRIKTHVRQIAPLTDRVTEILQEIAAERRQTKVRNVHGLVFTRANGKAITKDAITAFSLRRCPSRQAVLKTDVHSVDREFKSRPPRQHTQRSGKNKSVEDLGKESAGQVRTDADHPTTAFGLKVKLFNVKLGVCGERRGRAQS